MYPFLSPHSREKVNALLGKFSEFNEHVNFESWFNQTVILVYAVFDWESAQSKSFIRLLTEFNRCVDDNNEMKIPANIISKVKLQIKILTRQVEKETNSNMDFDLDFVLNENSNFKSNPFSSIKFFSGIYMMEIGKTPVGTKVYHFLYFEEHHDDSPDIYYCIREGCTLGIDDKSLRNIDATKYELHYIRHNISAENRIMWTNHYKNTFTVKIISSKLLTVTKVTPYSITELKYSYEPFPDYYDEEDEELPF